VVPKLSKNYDLRAGAETEVRAGQDVCFQSPNNEFVVTVLSVFIRVSFAPVPDASMGIWSCGAWSSWCRVCLFVKV